MPWALAAAAVTAVASAEQQRENNKNVQSQYNARNAVQLQGQQQQQQNAAQGQNILNSTLAKVAPAATQQGLAGAVANRTSQIQDNQNTPAAINNPTSNSNAPQVVQDSLAANMAKAAQFGSQQAGALGAIGGYTDAGQNTGLNITQGGQQLDVLNNFAKGDQGVNNAQAEAAYNNARKSPSAGWSLLGTAASALGNMYGAGGGSQTAAAIDRAPTTASAIQGVARANSSAAPGPIDLSTWS